MVRKSGYRRKSKSYKKKTSRYPKSMVHVGLGFPSKMTARLKYKETLLLSSASGSPTTYMVGMNCLYDPNLSGVGHQPMYFDQYMALYNHYHVIGARFTAKFFPYESNTVPLRIVTWFNDDASINTTNDIDAFAEQSSSKSTIIGSGGNSRAAVMTMPWSAKKTFGGSILSNDLLKGSSSANPGEKTVGCISIQTADKISSSTCIVVIDVEYVAVFSELRDVAQS